MRTHRIKLLLTNAAHGEQIFDAVKTAALLPQVDNSLRYDWPHAGQFLKFLHVRDVQIDWFSRWLLLSLRCWERQNEQKRHNQCADTGQNK